ncbi:MAG: hypothetical protein GY940_23110 [bacterium]|nr:hypothetical protein [bacterium]
MTEKQNNSTQPHHGRSQKYYKFLLYLVVLVLINLVSISLFKRADLTSNDLYSLSDASKKVVATLNEPLTVNVFFSKNLPAPYNNVELYLHDLLEEYEIYSNNNLSYRFYNVTADEGDLSEDAQENRKIAQSYGIYPVSVQKIERDETKVQRAFMGIALIHGDVVEKIPAVTSTEGLEYSITSAIQKMNNKISALVNLPEKIKINLILSSSMSQIAKMVNLQGMEGLKVKVQEVVAQLNDKTYDQLQFTHIDPSMNEGTPEQLAPFERFGLQWPEIPADKSPDGTAVPAGRGMIALGMSYKGKSIERNLLSQKMAITNQGLQQQYAVADIKEIETFINENIDNLIDINEDIGFLSSHGAIPLSVNVPPQMRMMQQRPEALNRFNGLLSKEYTVKEVKLEEGIPDSIDTLIIAGAKENFNEWELFQIDQFLMKGKSLALFINSFNEIQPQNQRQFQKPVYIPINTGLEKLLDHYGLKVKKSYLLDESCYVQRGQRGDEMKIYFAPVIKNEKINHSLDFLENVKQLIAIKVSPLEANQDKIKAGNLELEELFASSDKSWEMAGRNINLMPYMIQPPQDEKEKKSLPLAYLLEGEFPSYFVDKPVPAKPEKKDEKEGEEGADADKDKAKKEEKKPVVKPSAVKGEKEVIAKGKHGRIFLIGSSEVLKDNVLDEQGVSPNAVFLLNSIDYLNNREDMAIMRSKNQRFNPLDDTKPFTRFFVKWFNILGLPLLFIAMGIIIWISRKNRKRRIRMMFSQSK